MNPRIKRISKGIRLMKWREFVGEKEWIFAKSSTITGYIILRLRGYKPHMTMFGEVLRKNLV